MVTERTPEELRDECEIPDAWNVNRTAPTGSIEISLLKGEGNVEDAIIELIQDEGTDYAEVVITHTDMPGRMESALLERGETVDKINKIPSQCGVIGFNSIDAAVDAISELVDADGETVANIAATRNYVEHDSVPDVLSAVQQHADISNNDVKETFASI